MMAEAASEQMSRCCTDHSGRVEAREVGKYLRRPECALHVDPGIHDGGRPHQQEGAQPLVQAIQHAEVHPAAHILRPEGPPGLGVS